MPLEADAVDRAIVVATQGGLPLVARPYHAIGEQIGVSGEEVMARLALKRHLILPWKSRQNNSPASFPK